MSRRQDNIRFKVLPDMTLRGYQGDTARKSAVAEWICCHVGNPCGTVTTTGQRMVQYDL